jgi:hypothetical protein
VSSIEKTAAIDEKTGGKSVKTGQKAPGLPVVSGETFEGT